MSGREKVYLEEAFLSNWIAPLGPHVDGFETELAENLGVQCSLALNTGTVAMYLALLFNVSPGKRGFCSVFFLSLQSTPFFNLTQNLYLSNWSLYFGT